MIFAYQFKWKSTFLKVDTFQMITSLCLVEGSANLLKPMVSDLRLEQKVPAVPDAIQHT